MGGVLDEPIGPSKPPTEDPVISPSIDDLLKIKINEEDMIIGTNSWNAIAYGNGKYVAVGSSGYVTTSTDGINWTTPKQIAGSSYTWNGIIYANGKFVACGQYSYIAVSTNGTNWTTYKVDSSAKYHWNGIAYGNGKFVVVGGSGRYHHPPMVQVGQRRSIIIHMEAGCQLHMVMVNLLWQAIVVVTI